MKLLSACLPLLATLLLAAGVTPAAAQDPAAAAPIMPNRQLTPGDVLDVSLADLQVRGYSKTVRNVPIAVKRQVYASYGITHWVTGEYEVDHLIPLSIGGSNSTRNLWPESYLTEPWNARTKDRLEYRLLVLVRAGKLDLHTAQQAIATDWIAAYKQYVGPDPVAEKSRGRYPSGTGRAAGDTSALSDEVPDTETSSPGAAPAQTRTAPSASTGEQTAQVWVNTKSGVIWKPGSRYYGKTKQGQYMNAGDALKAGYHYAGGSGN